MVSMETYNIGPTYFKPNCLSCFTWFLLIFKILTHPSNQEFLEYFFVGNFNINRSSVETLIRLNRKAQIIIILLCSFTNLNLWRIRLKCCSLAIFVVKVQKPEMHIYACIGCKTHCAFNTYIKAHFSHVNLIANQFLELRDLWRNLHMFKQILELE